MNDGPSSNQAIPSIPFEPAGVVKTEKSSDNLPVTDDCKSCSDKSSVNRFIDVSTEKVNESSLINLTLIKEEPVWEENEEHGHNSVCTSIYPCNAGIKPEKSENSVSDCKQKKFYDISQKENNTKSTDLDSSTVTKNSTLECKQEIIERAVSKKENKVGHNAVNVSASTKRNNGERHEVPGSTPKMQKKRGRKDKRKADGNEDGERKTYTCEVCNKVLLKKSSLKSHSITHTGETPFTCMFCNKGFNVRSNLNVHLRLHTGQKPHQCEMCQKSFTQAGQLKQHMLIHRGEKPYTCDTCFRSFRMSSALTTHLRTHTGEKPFPCDLCSRSFSTSTSLKTHRVTHSGAMLFDCPLCGRQFNRRNNLNVHIKRHNKERSFTCQVCRNGFVMRAHLLNHLRNCHSVDIHGDEKKFRHLIQEFETQKDGEEEGEEIKVKEEIAVSPV